MDSVSNFSFVSRFCVHCGHQTNRTCAVDEAFCPILWTVQNLGFGRNFTQLEVLNVLLIANHLLCFSTEGIVRAMCLQITDWCIFVRVIFDLMHWPSDFSYSLVFLLDCCMWNTLGSEFNFKFRLSLVRQQSPRTGTALLSIFALNLPGYPSGQF